MTSQPRLPRILVVDDDPNILRSLQRAFTVEGYTVETAVDGQDGMRRYLAADVDLVVLDVMMAGAGGLGFCRTLRAAGDTTPILMLTARDAVDDRVAGLDAGADDYLTKPFALSELFARVRALTRRAPARPESAAADGITVDEVSQLAHHGGRSIQLTAIETVMLVLLLDNAGQTITRRSLADAIWGVQATPRSNAIDVYIGYLRAKLEADGAPRVIHTVRGVGYRFAGA